MDKDAGRIVVSGLTKVFGGRVRAVDHLSFTAEPGTVTGFLGPNGAGKTTTLRVLLGLVAPTAGTATIGGRRYRDLAHPLREVGAMLEASSFHPARSGRNHLRVYCTAAGIRPDRADEVLELVGLSDAAGRKVKGYSQGMRQRLGLATALLGDPKVLVLDEPANGLDPEGIAWLRSFLRSMATAEGRTVLVSSHVLSEVEQTVDQVVIISRGALVRQGSLEELADGHGQAVLARSPQIDVLAGVLGGRSVTVARVGADGLRVGGLDSAEIGHLAFTAGVELHELTTERSDLEDVFLALTTRTGGAG
ncbi:MAG: ATP-binding cassette domain-containing protein [Actinobacteria bacterium]|nr:ATP-binding cassette domain-containing protein [Actinomycetota bacterium]MBI3686619.1 ATP-binding cassette domain-containing protein [Actinomycetota bacterium]